MCKNKKKEEQQKLIAKGRKGEKKKRKQLYGADQEGLMLKNRFQHYG